jgi:hypothetical protein
VEIDTFSLKEFLVKINQVDYVFLTIKNVFSLFYSTVPTLMRLVVSGMLIGTLAMMIIRFPGLAMPNSFEILFDLSNISSVSFLSRRRALYLSHRLSGLSLGEIGEYFGGSGHRG